MAGLEISSTGYEYQHCPQNFIVELHKISAGNRQSLLKTLHQH
jgi:hypothetical protein